MYPDPTTSVRCPESKSFVSETRAPRSSWRGLRGRKGQDRIEAKGSELVRQGGEKGPLAGALEFDGGKAPRRGDGARGHGDTRQTT